MFRDVPDSLCMDVTPWFFTKIRFVGDLGVFVPITGKNTLSSGPFKRNPETTYATK